MTLFLRKTIVLLLCALLVSSLFACAPAAPVSTEATDAPSAEATAAPSAEPAAEPAAPADSGSFFDVDFNQVVFEDELVKITALSLRYSENDQLSLNLQIDAAPGNTYQYTNFFLRINGWTLPLMDSQSNMNVFEFLPDGVEQAAHTATLALTFPLSDPSFSVRLSEPREIQLRFEELSQIDMYSYMTMRTVVTDPIVNEAVAAETAPMYRENTTPLFYDETSSISLVGRQFGTVSLGDTEKIRTLRILFDVSAPAESEGSDVSFPYELYDTYSSEGDATGFRIPAGTCTAIVETIPAIFTSYAAVVFPGTHATWGVDVNAVLDESGSPLPEKDWGSALQTLTLPIQRSLLETDEQGGITVLPEISIAIDMTGLSPAAATAAPSAAPTTAP